MARGRKCDAPSVVQSMSTGREVRASEFVDDFTGEVVKVIQDERPVKVLPSAQDLLDQDNMRKAAAQRAILAGFPTLTHGAAKHVTRGAMVRRFTKS